MYPSSPMLSLPVELLSTIASHVLSSAPPDIHERVLARNRLRDICKSWRFVIDTNPEFWDFLFANGESASQLTDITANSREEWEGKAHEVLSKHLSNQLARAGRVRPLGALIRTPVDVGNWTIPTDFSKRVWELQLTCSPKTATANFNSRLEGVEQSMWPNLSTLLLRADGADPKDPQVDQVAADWEDASDLTWDTFDFEKAPALQNLRRLAIYSRSLYRWALTFSPSLSNVTHIYLRTVGGAEPILHMLRHMRSVEMCHLNVGLYDDALKRAMDGEAWKNLVVANTRPEEPPVFIGAPASRIHLPHLKKLDLNGPTAVLGDIMHALRQPSTPALEELGVRVVYIYGRGGQARRSYEAMMRHMVHFVNSPPSTPNPVKIKKLEITDLFADFTSWAPVFDGMEYLRHLTLIVARLDYLEPSSDFLRRILLTGHVDDKVPCSPGNPNSGFKGRWCPGLESVLLKVASFEHDHHLRYNPKVYKMWQHFGDITKKALIRRGRQIYERTHRGSTEPCNCASFKEWKREVCPPEEWEQSFF